MHYNFGHMIAAIMTGLTIGYIPHHSPTLSLVALFMSLTLSPVSCSCLSPHFITLVVRLPVVACRL